MELDTAMELSFWKEEPLSPFSGLVEEEADIWELFGDVKQDEQEAQDPLDVKGKAGAWLPDSPSDSCDSLSPSTTFSARAQLASQLLEDLDEVLIKQESFSDWYESKTDLPMFEELPSPTPSLCKDDALAGVASRPFAGLSLTQPLTHFAANVVLPAFAPAAPAAVHKPKDKEQNIKLVRYNEWHITQIIHIILESFDLKLTSHILISK
ncbi:uncharacterized protein LOC117650785 [Thrips palmi]|uniref:Uncharacterized protein LOC117650785 n=1 Tax=Thrips palmi TaxID=161013 RepID=A0A6P8ZYW2_THRPL|nr:uncharacterized protein LOC117650785 [Thrips palmi]